MDKELLSTFYQVLLNRIPNELEIENWSKLNLDNAEILNAIVSSEEFIVHRNFSSNGNFNFLLTEYTACTVEEINSLKDFHVVNESKKGYILDFLGTYTSTDFFHSLEHMSGTVEPVPVISNFHADVIEWVGLTKSITRSTGTFNALELGSGWCPWLVASHTCATMKGIKVGKLIGIEADSEHFKFGKQHFKSNCIPLDNVELKQGIISVSNKPMYFPTIDSNIDWGAKAINEEEYKRVSNKDAYLKKDSYTIKDLVKKFTDVIDLCHIDIQGDEFEIVDNAIDVLNKSVKFMIIGTHSRQIEYDLMSLLVEHDWILENEKPCKSTTGSQISIQKDGTQLWSNSRF